MEQNFQHLRKVSSQIFAMIMQSKFHKNRPKFVAIREPNRQTHRHTLTHRQGSFRTKIFSHNEMTEYKNGKNKITQCACIVNALVI